MALIVLVVLLALTLYSLFSQVKEVEFEGGLKTIGIVSVDDDKNTTSIIDVSINKNITKEANFTHLSVSSSVPYDHLVFYMPFDEDDDTNMAYDYVGDNDGTVNGVPDFVTCMYNDCYDLDGKNDLVALGDNDLFDFRDSSFTISLWVKGNATNAGIITKDDLDAKENGLVIISNGSNYLYGNGTGNLSFGESDDKWHHLAVTRESTASDRIKVYFDGDFVADFNDERTLDNSKSFIIGSVNDGTFFNGSIDEIMIFDAGLAGAEISNIYNNQSARFESEGVITLRQFNILDNVGESVVEVTTDRFENFPDSSLELRVGYWGVSDGYTDDSGDSINNGLIGYWHADSNPNDASGKDNNGEETGGVNYDSGVWGDAFDLDGINDLVNISGVDGEFNNLTGAVSFWVWPEVVESGDRYFSQSGGFIYFENGANNQVTFTINNLSSATGTLTLDRWNHVVGVYNSSGSKIFIDGQQVGAGSGTPVITLGSEFYLGLDNGGSAKFAPGLMDEIMVFDRDLDLDEVEELYVKGRANYQFTSYQEVDGSNEFDITDETTNLIPEYKFKSSANQFYTPLLFTGIHFDYSSSSSSGGSSNSFVDNGIINITNPLNGSNTYNRLLNVNYTVNYNNIGSCWYSNDTFNVNITLTNCTNITDVEWKRGRHEVRVFANNTNGDESASRVFFTILRNNSGTVFDSTFDDDFNQSDPFVDSPTIIVGDGETIELGEEDDTDLSSIVYYLIIGILLILIFIVIFLLIKATKSHGIIAQKRFK